MTDSVPIPPALLEQTEAKTYSDYEAAAPAAARTALGMAQLRIGGGVALAVRNDPSGFWSKTIGLGFTEPVTAGLLERVIEFYRASGMSAATLQFAPQVLPPDWTDICAKLNISDSGTAWVKLAGRISTVAGRSRAAARLADGLRVAPVPADRAREWAEATLRIFGFPAGHQAEMGAGIVGRPGWHTLTVSDGHAMVAMASLHISGSTGCLFGGATLPAARRQGAQSALIAARAEAAREAGCTWLIAETGAEEPGTHNTSLHNMVRAGMSVCYQRQNWTWREPRHD
jgi:GNAT superfamily N-acetyltransferase